MQSQFLLGSTPSLADVAVWAAIASKSIKLSDSAAQVCDVWSFSFAHVHMGCIQTWYSALNVHFGGVLSRAPKL